MREEKAQWELDLEEMGRQIERGAIPDEVPDPPDLEDKYNDYSFACGWEWDATTPAYWWVRYYYFIAHYAGEHQVAELCRLMAAVHNNTGEHPDHVWNSWLWAQINQRETKLTH